MTSLNAERASAQLQDLLIDHSGTRGRVIAYRTGELAMRTRTAAALSLALALSAGAGAAVAQAGGERLYGDRVLRCESQGETPRQCPADTSGGVRLARQLSDSDCDEGKSWGVNRSGVWVARGCSADFLLGQGGSGRDSRSGDRVLRCESKGGRWNHCRAESGNGVQLVRQLSKRPCIRDQNWGVDAQGLWVSGGCRGEFQLLSAGATEPVVVAPRGKLVMCESIKSQAQRCAVETGTGVRLHKQLSRTQCVEGRNWGYDGNGIWVEEGCRAEFEVDAPRGG